VLPFVNHYLVGGVALLALGVFALITYGRIDQAQILAGFGPLSRLPVAVQAILMLLLSDFIGYWTHRGFHGRRLWPIHAIHHSSRSLDWLSATRVHPVGEIIGRLAIMLPLLAMGFAPMAVGYVAPVIGVFGLLLHANLDWDWGPLRTVIASPRFHRWHHTSEADALDKNFAGLFPVWDILFGTYFMPRDRVPERFGTDTPVPDGLYAQMMFPFRRG
jgi:sterol desaturase/sphingolipid hydroxylase (fatty acid hydroxylase superfamily)